MYIETKISNRILENPRVHAYTHTRTTGVKDFKVEWISYRTVFNEVQTEVFSYIPLCCITI